MRLLLADDDADIRFVTGTVLTRRGWTITYARSGEEAAAILAAGTTFDVVVLDQHMPPVDGLEVVEVLRAQGDWTPAVLFTGFVLSPEQTAAAERYEVTVLDKIAIKQLPTVLERLAPPP